MELGEGPGNSAESRNAGSGLLSGITLASLNLQMRTLWTDERPKEQENPPNCGPRRRLTLIPVGMTSALRSGVCVCEHMAAR